MSQACHRFWKFYKALTFCSLLTRCRTPCACHTKRRFNVKSGANMWCFDVLCTFWLRNVLRATRAWNFSSLIWSHGSAPAALASLLFHPPEPQIIGKTQCFAAFLCFPTFSRIFFLLNFSSLIFFLLLSSLTLPTSAFPSVHIVGSLTSKLPSNRRAWCGAYKVKLERLIVWNSSRSPWACLAVLALSRSNPESKQSK